MKLFFLRFLSLVLAPVFLSTCVRAADAGPVAGRIEASAAERLAGLVQDFVERDEIVGAELLVVYRGQPILHRALGFKDREARQPMERDTFFALRSMTKPFTGMAAQLLIDEGKLELDAPVAKYLPSFANEKSRALTLRQVLTHRSGLPLGFVSDTTKPVSEYSGLRELADLSGTRGPDFTPGSRYLYSDAGSDVVGAIVAEVSGQSLERFIQERILEPLKLTETFPEARAGENGHRERTATRYTGAAESWTRYWSPSDPALYPFLKGSGGLFATPRDYARFLQFWMDRRDAKAVPGAKPLLTSDAFERALSPASRETMNVGFPGATSDYGQMWMLFRAQADSGALFGFGHGGSDGTLAYAFPEKELIVCYFTQSRGNTTRSRFEAALSHLFLKPDANAFAELTKPVVAGELAEFTGLYAPSNRADAIGAIIQVNGRLAFELANRQVMALRPTEQRDRWVPERALNDAVTFQRENGRIVGLTLSRNGAETQAPRFRPDASLPTVDELMALRARAVSPALFAALLPLRVSGTLESQGKKMSLTMLVDRDGRSFSELDLGEPGKVRVWIESGRVWREQPGTNGVAVELNGAERRQEIDGSLAVMMGDWRQFYADVIVLARESLQDGDVFRVRTVPREGFASTKFVRADTGEVIAERGIMAVTGAGLQPSETRFADFEVIEGVAFPRSHTLVIAGTRLPLTVREIIPRTTIDPATWARPTPP